MSTSQALVLNLYNTVIDDVIHNVSDSFLDEGVDEQVLQELKQMWTTKMLASKAVEQEVDRANVPPPNVAKSGVLNKGGPKGAQANGARSKAQQKAALAAAAAAQAAASQEQQQTNGGGGGGGGGTSTASAGASAASSQGGAAGSSSAATGSAGATAGNSSSNTQQNSVAVLDPYKLIPIQITLPPQGDSDSRVLTIHLPGSVIQNNQLGQMLTAPVIQSIMSLPPALASSVLQQHVNTTLQNNALQSTLAANRQLDGPQDTSDDEGSEISDDNVDGDDDDEDKDDDEDLENETGGAEDEPLNSEDDVTDEDASDLFDTDNVIVCQYDKITRSRNKWKFHLKDGIMNIGGKDFVFQRSNGDAEW